MWDLSSPTRDQTHIPCIGRWILNPWTTRKVLTFFSIPSISFLRHLTFFICFKYVHNISITSVLALVDCLFSCKLWFFLVLDMIKYFLLFPGYLQYYEILFCWKKSKFSLFFFILPYLHILLLLFFFMQGVLLLGIVWGWGERLYSSLLWVPLIPVLKSRALPHTASLLKRE